LIIIKGFCDVLSFCRTGHNFYPAGGWSDYKGAFESESEAVIEWWQIIHENEIVSHGRAERNCLTPDRNLLYWY
jgi:hypothetical protein